MHNDHVHASTTCVPVSIILRSESLLLHLQMAWPLVMPLLFVVFQVPVKANLSIDWQTIFEEGFRPELLNQVGVSVNLSLARLVSKVLHFVYCIFRVQNLPIYSPPP